MQTAFDFDSVPTTTFRMLCVVRHGHYRDRRLSDEGRDDINDLAELLKTRFQGLKVCLFSSPIVRAKESAEILSERLGIPFVENEYLAAPGDSLDQEQIEEALKLVAEKSLEYEVVVLCTHLPFIDEFPRIWGKTRGFRIHLGSDRAKGTAFLVDAETGMFDHVYPR